MWRDDVGSMGRWLVLALVVLTVGCASSVITPRRNAGRSASDVLRLATERGIEDLSKGSLRILRVPIEVRTDSSAVVLPGCAVRPFRTRDLAVADFSMGDIYQDNSVLVAATPTPSGPGASRIRLAAVDSTVHMVTTNRWTRGATPSVTVPPHSSQMVSITVWVPSDTLGGDELGLRLDSSPQAIGGPDQCIAPINSEDPAHVEHYLLPGILTKSGSLWVTTTALFLGVIILMTGF